MFPSEKTPVPPPRLSIRKVISSLFFLFLGMMGVITLLKTGIWSGRDNLSKIDSLHRDPDRIRPWAQELWDRFHQTGPTANPLDSQFQPGVTFLAWQPHPSSVPGQPVRQWQGDFLQDNPKPKPYQGDLRIVRLTSENPGFDIGGIPVSLRYIGHALPRPENLTKSLSEEPDYWSSRMYNQYFTPDAAPVNLETVRAELPEKIGKYIHLYSVNWHTPYRLNFIFTYPEILDLSLDFRGTFDPRSHESLSSGYGPRKSSHALELSTSLKTFSGASVENIFDIFHGPNITFSIDEPQPGSRLDSPHFTAVILGMGPGKFNGQSVRKQHGKNKLIISVDEKTVKSHTFFAFAFGPRSINRRIEIEAVDADGNTADVHVGQWGDDGAFAWVKMPFGHIRKLRFKYRTNVTRVYVETPLLAVPDENLGLTDLFDARVPMVRAQNEEGLRSMLSAFVQLQYRNRAQTTLPENAFPMTFEEMTLREILAEYLKLCPGLEVYVDETNMELVFDDGSHDKKFAAAARAWFRQLRLASGRFLHNLL